MMRKIKSKQASLSMDRDKIVIGIFLLYTAYKFNCFISTHDLVQLRCKLTFNDLGGGPEEIETKYLISKISYSPCQIINDQPLSR